MEQATNGTTVEEMECEEQEPADPFGATARDNRDMRRLGRQAQLKRYLRVWSIFAFSIVATAAWPFAIFSVGQGLIDGGRSFVIWTFIWCYIFFGPVVLSLAELASMAPIAGAQYNWVSEFSPENLQKILSYFTGWTTMLSYQAGNASGFLVGGTIAQTLISMNMASYSSPRWQGFLLVLAEIAAVYLVNRYCTKVLLYYAQRILLALSFLLYLFYVFPLFILAPHAEPKEVFFEPQDNGGWASVALAIFVGQLSGIAPQMGTDSPVHMSEEVRDASKVVPRAMLGAYAYNILTLPLLIAVCFAMKDITTALDPTKNYGYPIVYVLLQAMSKELATVILTFTYLLFLVSNVNYFAATSRELFAFARVSEILDQTEQSNFTFCMIRIMVHPERKIPANAMIVTGIVSAILTVIYVGSITAFFAIASLGIVAGMMGYIMSIASILWCRSFRASRLPKAHFSLGRWGIPINTIAIIFLSWCFFWLFWPQTKAVTPETFNWASVVFAATTILSISWYITRGRLAYEGPVVRIRDILN